MDQNITVKDTFYLIQVYFTYKMNVFFLDSKVNAAVEAMRRLFYEQLRSALLFTDLSEGRNWLQDVFQR